MSQESFNSIALENSVITENEVEVQDENIIALEQMGLFVDSFGYVIELDTGIVIGFYDRENKTYCNYKFIQAEQDQDSQDYDIEEPEGFNSGQDYYDIEEPVYDHAFECGVYHHW